MGREAGSKARDGGVTQQVGKCFENIPDRTCSWPSQGKGVRGRKLTPWSGRRHWGECWPLLRQEGWGRTGFRGEITKSSTLVTLRFSRDFQVDRSSTGGYTDLQLRGEGRAAGIKLGVASPSNAFRAMDRLNHLRVHPKKTKEGDPGSHREE